MSRLGNITLGFILGAGSIVAAAFAIDKYSETDSSTSIDTSPDEEIEDTTDETEDDSSNSLEAETAS